MRRVAPPAPRPGVPRGDHAGATLQGLRERAADIGTPELVKVTHEGELLAS